MPPVTAASNPALNVTMNGLPASSHYAAGGPRPPFGTINALFFDAVERFDRSDALSTKIRGVWEPLSHRTILERVRRTALGLAELGIVAQDRVAILSENRPEWLIADYACICRAITDVPIYPTLPADQLPYL